MVVPVTSSNLTAKANTPGVGDELVQTAYDLAVKYMLNNQPLIRNFVSVRPENPAMKSRTVIMEKFKFFDDATVSSAKAALVETADVDAVKLPKPDKVQVTAEEHGFVVTHTKYLENSTFVPFEQYKAVAIADIMGKTLDELLQDTIINGITGTTNTGNLTAQKTRDVGVKFLENNVPTWDGQNYVAVAHPRVLADLREEAGPGGWRVAKEYQDDSALKLLPNEVGVLDGVRYISNNRVRTSGTGSAKKYNTYFFGHGGLLENVIEEPHTVIGPEVDNLRRFRTLGWYGDLGWAIYEPLAIQRYETTASRA